MTRVTYEGMPVASLRVRAAVAWAVLLGRSVEYEVIARRGDVLCRVVRRVKVVDRDPEQFRATAEEVGLEDE